MSPPEVRFPEAKIVAQPQGNARHAVLVVLLFLSVPAGYGLAGGMGALVSLTTLLLPGLGALWFQRSRTPKAAGEVEVREQGLFADGALIAPRKDLLRAVVILKDNEAVVSIQRSSGFFIAVDVPNQAEGQRLVSALGLATEQRTADLEVDSRLTYYVPAVVLVGFLLVTIGALMVGMANAVFWPFLLIVPWYLFTLLWLRHQTMTVGTDGVMLSWFGMKRLFRFNEMVSCTKENQELRLEMANGHTLRIQVDQVVDQRQKRQPEFASVDAYLDVLVAKVEAARAAAGNEAFAELLRKGRPFEEWKSHLLGLLARGASGFREAPVSKEALWATLSNGEAPARVRVAALYALSPALDEGGKKRLRIAAETLVDPKLRIAIQAAADEDEESLVNALSELEGDEPKAPSIQGKGCTT